MFFNYSATITFNKYTNLILIGSSFDVSAAYSNAVALLNDPLTCTVSGGITVQDALGPQVITEIQPSLTVPLPVEIQQIEQPDSLPLPDIEEEEWPDVSYWL